MGLPSRRMAALVQSNVTKRASTFVIHFIDKIIKQNIGQFFKVVKNRTQTAVPDGRVSGITVKLKGSIRNKIP
eukprot:6260989-Karenia_brevis.AAC.1